MEEQSRQRRGRPKGAKSFDPVPALAFGAVVKGKRVEMGISQEELANLAQVERSHMGKIERGEHLPNLVLILRLAKALSVNPGLLVDRAAGMIFSD